MRTLIKISTTLFGSYFAYFLWENGLGTYLSNNWIQNKNFPEHLPFLGILLIFILKDLILNGFIAALQNEANKISDSYNKKNNFLDKIGLYAILGSVWTFIILIPHISYFFTISLWREIFNITFPKLNYFEVWNFCFGYTIFLFKEGWFFIIIILAVIVLFSYKNLKLKKELKQNES